MGRWRTFAASIGQEVATYRAIARHPNTPVASRALIAVAVGYLLSPIDLIPDFVPVLGHLDDVLIVPGLIALALWLVPDDVVRDAREATQRKTTSPKGHERGQTPSPCRR
ncbi:YkvA family protein [Arhodomonas aquaeolei]|uniref:YkvA family protein n=1 Tax=Arhodomonas aquaeolei TaxID=2369 RepID=UPI000360F455|nr:YkvA family protein [Arhodomonas aquaeolei]